MFRSKYKCRKGEWKPELPTCVSIRWVLLIKSFKHFINASRSARASSRTDSCELELGENVAAFLNNKEVETGTRVRAGETLVHR